MNRFNYSNKLALVALLLTVMGFHQTVIAQCSVGCNNNQVQLSVDENCKATIDADLIIEGYESLDQACLPVDIEVKTGNGVVIASGPAPVVISGLYGGQNLKVTAKLATGNSCWGTVFLEDKLPPVIECESRTALCTDDLIPSVFEYPYVYDNCDSNPSISYDDEEVIYGCGAQTWGVITRTWSAVDASGNVGTCIETITLIRPDLDDVDFPADVTLDCVNPNTDPSNTGVPTINGEPIDDVCQFDATYTDEIIPICENSYKLVRIWKAFDWCDNGIKPHNQVIKVIDDKAPIVNCPKDFTISTSAYDCTASLILPKPGATDNCSSVANITYAYEINAGVLSGNSVFNLPLGDHLLLVTVADDCGNEATCEVIITVEDQVAPVAICDEHTTVGLAADNPTLVPAAAFDDGSYDFCGDVTFRARRMDNTDCTDDDNNLGFGAYVPFYCCDLGQIIMVELEVTDAAGNVNTCMADVEVQDKLAPAIVCPADKTIECDQDYTDLTLTGEAIGDDNCSVDDIFYTDHLNLDHCGLGVVRRTWTVVDGAGLKTTCLQRITITNSDPFDLDDIIWPGNYDTHTCGGSLDPDDIPAPFDRPIILDDVCDQVAVTYEDTELPIAPPACKKILRKWIVVDWCTYDPNGGIDGPGYFTHIQVIKLTNSIAPEFDDCSDRSFCSFDPNCGPIFVDLAVVATDDCTPDALLEYSYKIDANNDGIYDFFGSTNDASGNYPVGTHRIVYTVEDGCSNFNTCEFLFEIKDCKEPTPYCINGISTVTMPSTGCITIWASEFDFGSYDNCTPQDELIFSFSEQTWDNSLQICCDDPAYSETVPVEIYVTDREGNQSNCETYMLVTGCDDDNTNSASIAGEIENEAGDMVEDVQVDIESNAPGLPNFETTGVGGAFQFTSLPIGYDYELAPSRDHDPLNGISTFDIVLMSKHILGIQHLDSPYKLIAGDVNKSGGITTFDIVELRKLILYIQEDFSNNTSWRFIDANYAFPQANNPFASSFPEVYSIEGLTQDEIASFVAVKVGDLNASAAANSLMGTESRHAVDELVFEIEDQELVAGETYTVRFAADAKDVAGYQFTLNFDETALDFAGFTNTNIAGLTENNFGFAKLAQGAITTSYNAAEALNGEAAFELSFTAKTDGRLSEVLSVSSEYTRAEGYNDNLELLDINFRFGQTKTTAGAFALHQNTPNPFKAQTNIAFELPEAGDATLTIYDVTGRTLKTIQGTYAAGYHTIELGRNELTHAGVLYYTLQFGDHIATQKMIVIE